MLSSPSHQQRQRDSLFPSVHAPSSSSSSSLSSSSVAASFVRRSTKFSSRECSVSSVIYITTKVRLAGPNRPPEELGTFAGSLAPNQCSKGLSVDLSVPSSLPPSNCVTLLHASDKITVLPPSKPFPPSTGQVHCIPIKQLVAPAMPLLPSSAVGTSPASASSSAASPSARPLRVAQPPPLATAFPSCSSTIPQPPNSVDASSSFLPNSISVPSLPKPAIQFHRSVASVSSEIGSRTGTTNKQQNAPGGLNGRGDRGRSRFVQKSYEELLELARNQQRQIEANEDELDERRKAVALFGVAKRTAASQSEQQQNARILMANLRAQISHDEMEMVHLGKRQKEAKKLREHNEKQSRELAQLENEYGHDDEQLRRAVAKVDALRRQLEMLYQHRAMAADAAAFQQRQINAEENAEKGSGRVEKRPKASVVPFKVTEWRQGNGEETCGSANEADFEGGDGQCRGENEGQRRQSPQKCASSLRPPAFQPPINWRRTTPQVDQFSIKRNSMTALKRLSWVAENGGDEYLMNFVVNEQKKGRTHISFGEMVPKPAEGVAEKERIGTNEERGETESTDNGNNGQMHLNAFKGQRKVIGEGAGGSDQLDIPTLSERTDELREEKQTEAESQTTEERQTSAEKHTKVPFEEEGKTQPKTAEEAKSRTDQRDTGVQLVDEGARSRDLEKPKETASKVSSPMKRMAVQENSWEFHKKFAERLANKTAKDEEEMGTDEKRKEEEEEEKRSEREEEKEEESVTTEESQQRERRERQSNLNTTPAFGEVFKGRNDQQQLEEEEEKEGEEEEGVWEDKHKEKWVERRDEESEPKCEERPKEGHMAQMPAEIEVEEENPAEMFDSPPLDEMTTDESSSSAGEETPIVFEESLLAMPRNVKGILRRSDTVREEKKRRVMFDLIVLFLDVAYEGQYDTLVELAAKIEDISIANSEGTTALHYAICAGNFDIVKFLIENGADVNALDVDGWSPLHCAASCNNPKMLRQLIENGACPFATTFGMSETATQLFDETLDFAVAADYMEMVENCMGMLNDGKVYAAYSYEAEKEDELSFLEGDELRVLRKSEEEGTEGGGERPAGDADADGTAPTHFWWFCEHCASEDKGLVPRNYLSLYPTWKFRSRYPTDFEVPRPSRSIAEQIDERTAASEGCQRKRDEISDGQANGREGQRELSTYA